MEPTPPPARAASLQHSVLALYAVVERGSAHSDELGDGHCTTDLDTTAVQLALHPDSESSPSSTALFGLLKGDIAEIQHISRSEAAKWLMDMAHDICGPHLSRGTLAVYTGGHWHHVQESDALVAANYVYYPPGLIKVADLTAICDKHEEWRDFTYSAASTEMRVKLLERDKYCWISGLPLGIMMAEGHIFPVTLADTTVQHIVSRFCKPNSEFGDTVLGAPTSAHSISAGISISVSLSHLFNTFDMGFRLMDSTQNIYTCHLFYFVPEVCGVKFTTAGLCPISMSAPYLKPLHGHKIEPPQPLSNERSPLPGLFRWHYLQCVIHKFGHQDYKRTPHLAKIVRTDQDNRARPWRGRDEKSLEAARKLSRAERAGRSTAKAGHRNLQARV